MILKNIKIKKTLQPEPVSSARWLFFGPAQAQSASGEQACLGRTPGMWAGTGTVRSSGSPLPPPAQPTTSPRLASTAPSRL